MGFNINVETITFTAKYRHLKAYKRLGDDPCKYG